MAPPLTPPAPRQRRRALATLAVGALASTAALTGCSSDAAAADGADGADGKPLVLTTFTVIADMVENVAGDRVQVESITKPGAEVHGYEPTPGDLKNAANADLVMENGLGLERWFEQFVQRSDADFVNLSEGVDAISITGESEHAGKPNPHAWMSVKNADVYVDNIRDALIALDPPGEAHYTANADEYRERLAAVGTYVEDELGGLPPEQRVLVTCEGAFSYMARDFGMEEAYLWPVNAEQEGTPKQIASVVEKVRDDEVPAVFCESTVSDKAQRQVARESGAELGGVLYVDSLSEEGGPVPTYEELLRKDAETIVAGLTGRKK